MRISIFKWTIMIGKYARSILIIGITAILIITGCYIYSLQSSGGKAVSAAGAGIVEEGLVVEHAGMIEVDRQGNGDVNGVGKPVQGGGDPNASNATAQSRSSVNMTAQPQSSSNMTEQNRSSSNMVAQNRSSLKVAAQNILQSNMAAQSLSQSGETEQNRSSSAMTADDQTLEDQEQTGRDIIHIYVTGAVNKPGVYTLEKSSMVVDAIEAAGGLSDDADEENINMVFKLENNAMLSIKRKTDISSEQRVEADGSNAAQQTDATKGESIYGSGVNLTEDFEGQLIEVKDNEFKADGDGVGNSEKAESLININTASKGELSLLPGIGSTTADNIIGYREKSGGFKTIEDIMKVTGIKQAKFAAIKEFISV